MYFFDCWMKKGEALSNDEFMNNMIACFITVHIVEVHEGKTLRDIIYQLRHLIISSAKTVMSTRYERWNAA